MNGLKPIAGFPNNIGWATATACFVGFLAAAPEPRQAPTATAVPVTSSVATLSGSSTTETNIPSAAARVGSEPATTHFPPPVAEVVRLLESGVSKEVVKSFIDNSRVVYFLPANQIIALTERGVPGDVIVAMLAQNRELRTWAVAQVQPNTNLAPYAAAPAQLRQAAPAYDPAPQATSAEEWPVTPAAYPYSYSYWYWTYPALWFWNPIWTYSYFYPRRHPHSYWAGDYRSSQKQPYWPNAYPNRLITGPNWGADRGFIPSQGRWSGAYPNRLITGPTWGADRGLVSPQARWPNAYPNRLVTGPTWSAGQRQFAPAVAPRPGGHPNGGVTGPTWGANRGFAPRPAVPAARASVGTFQRPGGAASFRGASRGGRG